MRDLSSTGFTIVELIVVIIIISILATLSVTMINPALIFARSRDSKRISDLGVLMSAVERYNIDRGNYPDVIGVIRTSNNLPDGQSGPLQSASNGWIKADLSRIISKLPTDPLNREELIYRYIRSDASYEIDATLEKSLESAQKDGGNNDAKFEVGNDMTLLP